MVVWQKPNLLVLDEPTNHLDLEMRHAMEVALQAYEGAVILVTHDRHMLRNTAEELLLVHDGKVEEYGDDLKGYERWILSSLKTPQTESTPKDSNNRKEKRQQAAADRARLRPLQKQINQLEKGLAKIEASLLTLQDKLGDSGLYEAERKEELADLLKREGELKTEADTLEAQWLAAQEELEAIS